MLNFHRGAMVATQLQDVPDLVCLHREAVSGHEDSHKFPAGRCQESSENLNQPLIDLSVDEGYLPQQCRELDIAISRLVFVAGGDPLSDQRRSMAPAGRDPEISWF